MESEFPHNLLVNIAVHHADLSDAATLADLISRSYADVAERFGIDANNAPSHPSNATPEWIRDDIVSGVLYLLADVEARSVACVGYRKVSPDTLEAQRLAVLPEYRGGTVANQLNK